MKPPPTAMPSPKRLRSPTSAPSHHGESDVVPNHSRFKTSVPRSTTRTSTMTWPRWLPRRIASRRGYVHMVRSARAELIDSGPPRSKERNHLTARAPLAGATLVLLTLVACSDLREFRGSWQGPLVGDTALQVNPPSGPASLAIEVVDSHHLRARLAIAGLLPETVVTSLEAAEADVLSDITFGG